MLQYNIYKQSIISNEKCTELAKQLPFFFLAHWKSWSQDCYKNTRRTTVLIHSVKPSRLLFFFQKSLIKFRDFQQPLTILSFYTARITGVNQVMLTRTEKKKVCILKSMSFLFLFPFGYLAEEHCHACCPRVQSVLVSWLCQFEWLSLGTIFINVPGFKYWQTRKIDF